MVYPTIARALALLTLAALAAWQLDLADCFGIKAAEVGFDALHHSLWWNVSQNVGRTDVIPRPGITGCITPGGENFGPHRGRCILGYEKLLLGGIPVDKLLLGTETEVQLSDLAGNAVSTPAGICKEDGKGRMRACLASHST